MGNVQGRSSQGHSIGIRKKSPRSGKYPPTHASNSQSHQETRSGPDTINSNHKGPTKYGLGSRETPMHLPVSEYDLPDFLQKNQNQPRSRSQSPVVRRNLGDPDPVISDDVKTNKGLLIPRSELEVPDFLIQQNSSSGHNGKVAHFSVNHTSENTRTKNGPTIRVRRTGNHSTARDPSNVRARSTVGLHTSSEQLLNVDSDSHRHARPTESHTDINSRTVQSPPIARGTVVISCDPSTSKSTDIAGSRENLRNIKQATHASALDISTDIVDDFGHFSLKRKYKKGKGKSKSTTLLSDKDRFAPGVTGKYAINSQTPHASTVSSSTVNNTQLGKGDVSNSHQQLIDTDSIQSTSSQSFTETFSPRDQPFHGDTSNAQMGHNFELRIISPQNGPQVNALEYDSPSSEKGYMYIGGDASLGYQDSSLEESSKKISRKNSLQAHLRNRIKEYERIQKEQSLQRMRYDSDSTTVSDQSIFSDTISSVTRLQPTGRVTCHINNLHEDLLLRIFSYLTTTDLCRISGVCRKWQILCWDPVLWYTIEILNHQDSDINRILRNVLTKLATSTQGYCLTVHCIKLNGSELLSDKGLGFIARFCIDLEELEILGCCCITSKGLQEVLLNCHNLHYLNLGGCSCINSICAPTANGFSIGDHGSFLRLQHLDLSDCVAFDDLGLRTVGLSCGMLEKLYLRRCSRITDVGIKHIANHCHHLKELSTSDCYKVRDFSLKEIARNVPGLKYLSVAKCPVSDTGIKYIGRHCVRLKYLNVRGCEAITDVGIAYVVQNCLKLRSLDIGKCDITDNAMHTIGIHCPQLKKLSMKGCERVSNAGVKSIAAQCCNIQYLNVQECNLNYETFLYIREHCRNCIIEHTCPAFF